jgi:hypothetical protein
MWQLSESPVLQRKAIYRIRAPAAWTLWYEDEAYEDCDDPTDAAYESPGEQCRDMLVRGPSFVTREACQAFGQEFIDRTPAMPGDVKCVRYGTIIHEEAKER